MSAARFRPSAAPRMTTAENPLSKCISARFEGFVMIRLSRMPLTMPIVLLYR